MTSLKNCKIVTEDGIIENGFICFDSTIQKIGNTPEDGEDCSGGILIPGFIDQHIHGVGGYDVMDGTFSALEAISKQLPREGTTSYFATTLTESEPVILKALSNIHHYIENNQVEGAELLGVHLEGPFISCQYAGAQSVENIKEIRLDLFESFQKASGNHILSVTMAPEKENALLLMDALKKQNIVISLGHSNANYHEVEQAIAHGANCFTHAYNAMSKLHHRDIGMVGAMLLHKDTYAEMIADGIHVSDEAISLLYQNKTANRTILITDSMRAKGMKDGKYSLGSQTVRLENKKATLEDGTLAGSVLEMMDGVKRMRSITNADLSELVQMASVNPAKIHHLDHRKGSIALHKDADLLLINNQMEILRVYCRGIRVI